VDLGCGIEVYAERYAPTHLRDLPFATAQNRQVEVKSIMMTPADRSISGVVVDVNGVPAPALPIFVSGTRGLSMAGQPRHEAASDAQGRFLVEGVSAAPLRIQAGFGNSVRGPGMMEAHGGDRDIRIVLGRQDVHLGLKSLLGRPLPDWKGLIELDPASMTGKLILVCFFDLGQRPSRRCVEVLAQRAEALRQKGVIVAAVQIGAVDEAAWKSWVKEHGDKLPFGQVLKDAEKVKSAWGVPSLPWLILTDRAHVVRAEGFSLDELEAKMQEESRHAKP
jgi:hypothetical protein